MTPTAWHCRDKILSLERPLIMGILNVTPDSFSDGGRFMAVDRAVAHGLRMVEEGADILDIGGESTRPGSLSVSMQTERDRILPVVRELSRLCDKPISIDTGKAEVARQALAAGACIVNDVTALLGDPAMCNVARESGAGVVLMHMKGLPRTMQKDPVYDDVVTEVHDWLAQRVAEVIRQGIRMERLAIDPGIGFGKTLQHNLALLGALERFLDLGPPLLVGLSRKGLVGAI